jgi:hypothetical protein
MTLLTVCTLAIFVLHNYTIAAPISLLTFPETVFLLVLSFPSSNHTHDTVTVCTLAIFVLHN